MAPEGLAALAASDEDLDSRTPVARLVPAAEGGYKEGTGIRGGWEDSKKNSGILGYFGSVDKSW